MSTIRRARKFIDRSVQGALVFRAVLYWAACFLLVLILSLCTRIVLGPPRSALAPQADLWLHLAPAAIAALLLLPIVVLDAVQFSHRFAGPVHRLRRQLQALAAGQRVTPLQFRAHDYWQDLAQEVDAVAARLEQLRPSPSADAGRSFSAEAALDEEDCELATR